jgi:hypothetical protein
MVQKLRNDMADCFSDGRNCGSVGAANCWADNRLTMGWVRQNICYERSLRNQIGGSRTSSGFADT